MRYFLYVQDGAEPWRGKGTESKSRTVPLEAENTRLQAETTRL